MVERDTILSLSAEQLQVADSEAVHPYILVLFDAAQVLDMSCLQVLSSIQVVQDSTCGYHALWQVVHTKTLEVLHIVLFGESLVCSGRAHHPVVQFEGEVFIAEGFFEVAFLSA